MLVECTQSQEMLCPCFMDLLTQKINSNSTCFYYLNVKKKKKFIILPTNLSALLTMTCTKAHGVLGPPPLQGEGKGSEEGKGAELGSLPLLAGGRAWGVWGVVPEHRAGLKKGGQTSSLSGGEVTIAGDADQFVIGEWGVEHDRAQ